MSRLLAVLGAAFAVIFLSAGYKPTLGDGGSMSSYVGSMSRSAASMANPDAVTIAMTSWSFTSGGTNFQLISGSFSPAASSQIRVEDVTVAGYLYADALGSSTTISAVAIAGLSVGHEYKLQVRAYTGSFEYELLPWVQYGVQWTQPAKLDPAEEQSG